MVKVVGVKVVGGLRARGISLGAAVWALAAGACVLNNPGFGASVSMSDTGSESESGTTGDSESDSDSLSGGDPLGEFACARLGRCGPVDPPAIACYELEGLATSESPSLVDSSGCDHHGTIEGNFLGLPGVHGDGLMLKADDAELHIDWPQLDNFTITAWVAIPDPGDQDLHPLEIADSGAARLQLQPPSGDSQIWRVVCTVQDDILSAEFNAISPDHRWRLITCGCGPSEDTSRPCRQVFASVNDADFKTFDRQKDKPLGDGKELGLELAPWLTGCLDSIRLWNRALTPGEVAAIYAEPRDPPGLCKSP